MIFGQISSQSCFCVAQYKGNCKVNQVTLCNHCASNCSIGHKWRDFQNCMFSLISAQSETVGCKYFCFSIDQNMSSLIFSITWPQHNFDTNVAQFGTTCMWLLAERNFSLWTAYDHLKKIILRFEANQWGKTIKILPRGLLREYGLPLCPRRRQITPKSLVKQLQHSAQIWTPGRNSPWRFASRNVAPVPPFTWVPRTI